MVRALHYDSNFQNLKCDPEEDLYHAIASSSPTSEMWIRLASVNLSSLYLPQYFVLEINNVFWDLMN